MREKNGIIMCDNNINEVYLSEEGKPFETCLLCNESLSELGYYAVTKVYKNYPELQSRQLLFEHAMCLNCVEKSREELSKESLEAIETYQMAKMMERMKGEKFTASLDECLFSQQSIEEEGEFAYYGMFQGQELVEGSFPFAVGQTAMEEMQGLLSQKTKETLDGFIDTHFSGPPEIRELLKDSPVVLL